MLIWECGKPMLKKLWFEKEFTPYLHFTVYDYEAMLEELNEKPKDDLTYLSGQTPISVATYDTLSKEPVYLVDESLECLIERFMEVLTEKHEEKVSEILKQHPHPPDFKMVQAKVKKQWIQWVNQVPVKSDTNIVKKHFPNKINYNKEDKSNVLAAKKENEYMF